MAYAKLTDGTYHKISPEQGAHLWLLFNGELQPTKEEEVKMSRVERLILNRHNPITPLSYLIAHPDTAEADGQYAAMLGMRK